MPIWSPRRHDALGADAVFLSGGIGVYLEYRGPPLPREMCSDCDHRASGPLAAVYSFRHRPSPAAQTFRGGT
jgi:hypothetical protein